MSEFAKNKEDKIIYDNSDQDLQTGVWLENNEVTLRNDLLIQELKSNEALVKVLRAGICNTDLELVRGYYPFTGILGHEFVGVVEKGPSHLLNKRVVGEINLTCGNCKFCESNQKTHCLNRKVLGIKNHNGAFAEYLTLPVENLFEVPENVTTDAATFTEPLAAALEIQQQLNITTQHKVIVIGDGKLGQLVAQTIALTGCDLTVIGRHDEKLALLQKRGINTGYSDSILKGEYDISIDCTGNSEGFNLARKALRSRGTLVMKSTYAGDLTINASSLVVDEITLIGSRCGPFQSALHLLSEGKVDVECLIQGRYSLSDALSAFEHAKTRGTLKILLNISNDST